MLLAMFIENHQQINFPLLTSYTKQSVISKTLYIYHEIE